ncbi:hypothetical protein DACRYDRAFT_24788 [Dacryopinax primogenitus]|uniref:Uncharacterized protein n=1 Tax=Dacryopinax primogenitus (strain DJM 731) TaxID=1858805 RepID=M5FQL8_DACPD|nr:uncharacterized protein DACRYDRAFT_24788 [Dacryopinax primogenitus]EJT97828.1 hypothetical protein DACRYDRAFT_24788 [Dacryopinax primogenitus]
MSKLSNYGAVGPFVHANIHEFDTVDSTLLHKHYGNLFSLLLDSLLQGANAN